MYNKYYELKTINTIKIKLRYILLDHFTIISLYARIYFFITFDTTEDNCKIQLKYDKRICYILEIQ